MPKISPLALIMLAACTTNPPRADAESAPPRRPISVHGVTSGHKCTVAGTEKFVGAAGTSRTGAAIKRASKAAVLRWAPPGYMLTMDYREDRVTVYLGPDRKVTKISCG